MEQWIPECCRWIIKYAGCLQDEVPLCMGPARQWWLFDLPLASYPYMVVIAALLAPLIYAAWYTLMPPAGSKRKEPMDEVLKRDLRKVAIVFFAVLLLEMVFQYWWQSGIVY